MNIPIYFDNAATTYPKPDYIVQNMLRFYQKFGVNSGRGSYHLAREANSMIDNTRIAVAKLLNTKMDKVKFSASATIALNQIIGGLNLKENDTIYITPFEHNAVARPLEYYRKKIGFQVEMIPYNKEFELDKDKLEYQFSRRKPTHIIMTHISNVTGYIVEIEEIINIARDFSPIIIVDGAQSVGLIPIDLSKLDVDYLVFAGHKTLYGPFGIAGFISNSKQVLKPVIFGGSGSDSLNIDPQYGEMEVGSPNILSIAGLFYALKWLNKEGVENIYKKEKELTNYAVDLLQQNNKLKLYLPIDLERHVGIISLNHKDYSVNDLGQILDEEFNVSVRTGYHCAPYIHKMLGTEVSGTVRISFGSANVYEEITIFKEYLDLNI